MLSLRGVLPPLLLVAVMLELTAINRNEVRRTMWKEPESLGTPLTPYACGRRLAPHALALRLYAQGESPVARAKQQCWADFRN